MRYFVCVSFVMSVFLSVSANAIDYRVEVLSEAPPADQVSGDIASALQPTGVRVIRGTNAAYWDIWLRKEVPVNAGALPAKTMYPFGQGQLVGVVRFARSVGDFRDQKLVKGVYTIRYAAQPADGNHEGTFPTRDFIVLMRGESDEALADIKDEKQLNDLSAAAAESSHPAQFPLLKTEGEAKSSPSIRHDEQHDWWIVRLRFKTKVGGAAKDLDVDLVVAGKAEE